MAKLGDFLKSINNSKEDLYKTGKHDILNKEYSPFHLNRCLSYFPDTALLAQEMNIRDGIPKRLQYQFYRILVRKAYRYSPWNKLETVENIEIVKEYYGYSHDKAIQALKVLSEDQLKIIKTKLCTGGIKK